MLKITIPATELYDEQNNRFYKSKETTLSLEHSLVSISKWESKWHKAFYDKRAKTREETLDYIRCMTISPTNVDPTVYLCLNKDNFDSINNYISDPMTASFLMNYTNKEAGPKEVVTSELIYYWMISLNIPFDPCQKWHINRLFALIGIAERKNAPKKSFSKRQMMTNNAAMNAARRAKYHSKG